MEETNNNPDKPGSKDFLNLFEDLSHNQNRETPIKCNIPNNPNQLSDPQVDESVTQEYFNRQYPEYKNKDNIIPPSKFSFPSKNANNDHENEKEKVLDFIEKLKVDGKYKKYFKNFSMCNWLQGYILVSGCEIQTVEYTFTKLKKYSFQCSPSMCEVKAISQADCLQIITVVDINLKRLKLLVTKEEENKMDYSKADIKSIVHDYYFDIGDVLLVNLEKARLLHDDTLTICLKSIEILN